jgi:hypothetical protein
MQITLTSFWLQNCPPFNGFKVISSTFIIIAYLVTLLVAQSIEHWMTNNELKSVEWRQL